LLPTHRCENRNEELRTRNQHPTPRVSVGHVGQQRRDDGKTIVVEKVEKKTKMDGSRAEDGTIVRLAVPQLPVDRGFHGGYDGWRHGGRVEHTAGHGLLDSGQRRADCRPIHGRVSSADIQPIGYVPSHILGCVVRSVPDDRQSGDRARYQHRG